MSAVTGPPRWSRWMLARVAQRLRTPDLVEDAAEIFQHKVTAEGEAAARRWYRAQVVAGAWRCRPSVPGGTSLDLRLGFRMLRRYPSLTVIGGLAMAFAIFVGAVTFEFIRQTLPGDELPVVGGERVVGFRWWDRAANRPVQPTWQDVSAWRESATSADVVGAYLTVTRQIEAETGRIGNEQVALMTPDGFALAGVAPFLGRTFTEQDIARDGSAIAVIGYPVWQSLFDGRADVVGSRVKVGRVSAIVIGVMPEGFKFPLNHSFWMPLNRENAGGAGVRTFARLREGWSQAQAQSQLEAHQLAQGPDARRDERVPIVQRYRESLFDTPLTLLIRVLTQQINVFAGLFVALVAANIALLMYARAASREKDLLVRVALGASRRRIVAQFLVEAGLLFGGATLLGLAATGPGLGLIDRRIGEMGGGTAPFWFTASVSVDTMIYAAVLCCVAVALAGGLPALRATTQLTTARINGATTGAGRLHLGGFWRLVIVGQVAATVLFVAGATLMWRQAHRSGSVDAAFPATEYLAVRVGISQAASPDDRARALRLLVEAAHQQPGIRSIAIADRLPLMTHEATMAMVGTDQQLVSVAEVDGAFFDTFRATLVAGRLLNDADVGRSAVVVDEAFVGGLLDQRSVIGRQLHLAGEPGAVPDTLEIVGVIRSLESDVPGRLYLDDQTRPFLYRPMDRSALPSALHLALHVPTSPPDLIGRLRSVAATHDDVLMVSEIEALDTVVRAESAFWQLWAEIIVVISLVTLVLALAGVYAVMSFTVTRRTREIGIRLALGARGHRIVWDVLRGPLQQVGAGLVLGSGLATAGCAVVIGGLALPDVVALASFGVFVALICALACAEPVRRVLGVQPTRALASGD